MSKTLLIELGCEELPARALRGQLALLRDGLVGGLEEAGLIDDGAGARTFATPRRLSVAVDAVRTRQPDRRLERKGPAESAAFDDEGNPTRAAEGFARSVGVPVAALDRLENEQGRWLYAVVEQPGRSLAELLPDMLARTVRGMAGARSMRWSDRDDRFLRPVRWLVALHGDEVVPAKLFGLASGRTTRGHRIHAPGEHTLASAADYESVLESAFVVADFDQRRGRIAAQVRERAREVGLSTTADDALLDEVTGLVEWPVAVCGSFDASFLEVPQEALVSSLREHQKSFPLFDADGALAPRFITVANLESTEPDRMIHGFERVIRPRLGDARFFYDQDRQRPLVDRFEQLDDMLFQEQLGSLADKSRRLAQLAAALAPAFDADAEHCSRAAKLCKCDLLTEMVGEFPELQGTMGRYYAAADGEAAEVAAAIESHYLPRHAGDVLPEDAVGQTLAVADRLDSLVGVFAAGKKPKSGKDPFGLRRAALAIVRILEATRCPLSPRELIDRAADALAGQVAVSDDVRNEIERFLAERLRSHLGEQGMETNTLRAVTGGSGGSVADFADRARAVQAFADDPEVSSLIAANKRAANLLGQVDSGNLGDVDRNSMTIDAERELFDALIDVESSLDELLSEGDYPGALKRLAGLRPFVDRFFDDVMVMVDDEAARANRLALLHRLRSLFLRMADAALLGRA